MEAEVKNIINTLNNNVFIISEIMTDKKEYKALMNRVFDYLRAGFEIKELREATVRYQFHSHTPEKTMQLRHFLTNIIFWKPMIDLDAIAEIGDHLIVDTSKISSNYIETYINDNIVNPYRTRVSNRKLNKILHDVIFNLSRISTDFNIILGLTINLETFIDVANKNPRFDEIIHTNLNENMQPKEIEKYLHELMLEELKILKTEDNSMKPMLLSGTGIKNKQLAELSISGGLKPDISGKTMPIPINSNFITSGLSSVKDYYIDSMGGRKSLIANKFDMGKSGYFSKKVAMCSSHIKLSENRGGCNTVNPLTYEIKTKDHIKRLRGRLYKDANSSEYKLMMGDEFHLVGSSISVRSPITCACKNSVCEECYGPILYHTNKDIDIGAYAGAKITNPLSQSILSIKHLLTTVSELISFVDTFHRFFTLSANEIVLNSDIDDVERYSLMIINENIVTIDDLSEGEIIDFVTIFHVKDNVTGEVYEIYEKTMKEMFISPELYSLLNLDKRRKKGKVYEIKFTEIMENDRLFLISIENDELTKPLRAIMGLLDVKKVINTLGISTVDEYAQTMLDLSIESGLRTQAIHGEMLLRPLVRNKGDVLNRPMFNRYMAKDNAMVLTISEALEHNPSPLIGLSYAQLKRQIQSPLTFKKRGTSIIDPFFKLTL